MLDTMAEQVDRPLGTSPSVGAFFRSRRGRRTLVLALLVAIGLLAWQFVDRLPAGGVVEVRWTEDPPESVEITYRDLDGQAVRWRREAIQAGASVFRDAYEVSPGPYWVRIEIRQRGRIRSILKKVDLPTADPYVLYLDEQRD